VRSSLAADSVDWSRDVSGSHSAELESARWDPSATTRAAGEERGGGKVASLIVEDIHNIPIRRMVYFCRQEYLKEFKCVFWGWSPN
jgi:hypothetical protein